MLQNLLQSSMAKAGLQYLSNQNILILFQNPAATLGLLLLVLVSGFYMFVEITAIIIYCERGMMKEKIGVFSLFWQALKRATRILRPRNGFLLLFVLIIIPLTGFSLTTGPMRTLEVPSFILDFVYQYPALHLAYLALNCLLLLLLFRWIFSLHEVTLTGCSFRQACHNSRVLIKGRLIKTFWTFLLFVAVIGVLTAIAYYLALGGLIGGIRLFYSGAYAKSIFWSSYGTLSDMASILGSAFTIICRLGLIATLYYQCQSEKPLSLSRRKGRPAKQSARLWSRRAVKGLALLAILVVYLYSTLFDPGFMPNTELFHEVTVTAHRGGALFAPENTMAALEEAVRSGAEYAEIDVQQTKDGQLILMHDGNLKRTTGVNKNVWDVTLAEALTYNATAGFRRAYPWAPIPTLAQALEYSQGRITLMIELKSTGHENQLEESVVQLIEEMEMTDQCIIASMNHDILVRAKELNPDIPTAYITALILGDFYDLPAVDMFSLESTYLSRDIVRSLHDRGKQVFAWTVNKEAIMRRMIDNKVDSIITDNPYLANYVLASRTEHVILDRVVDAVFGPG